MKKDLNAKRLDALSAICNTIIGKVNCPDDPEGYWAREASDLGVPNRILSLVGQLKEEDRAQFYQLLDLLSSPLLGLTWGGPFRPAAQLSKSQIERLLHTWSMSRLGLLRQSYSTLRKATAFLYFGDLPKGFTANPNHAPMGYQLPDLPPIPDLQTPLISTPAPTGLPLHCEVLVIGSGAGGSIAAAVQTSAGKDVIVVEKGPLSNREDFSMQEFPMMQKHFEAGAMLATKSGSVSILAGSTAGGGTAINWAGALRTPPDVLDEWARVHQNPHFAEPAFQDCFKIVEKRNSISTGWPHNAQNHKLMTAANALGWQHESIPMNIKIPEGVTQEQALKAFGFSCLGDAHGTKQGANETFLRDAVRGGARLLANTKIEKINIVNGRATGAVGVTTLDNGQQIPVTIHAEKVIVSAGALHTPVLLIKSGIAHPEIGRNLYLHPVMPTAGLYTDETLPWFGPMMSVVVQSFARLDDNWGYRIECPPVHPGLGALALSWENSAQIKTEMLQLKRMAVFFCLVRDRFGGRVTVGKKSGAPMVHYDIHSYDRRHLVHGMQQCAALHQAAQAERISILHNKPLHFYPGENNLSVFQSTIAAQNWGTNYAGIFSAHQMGTCRMGGTKDYPVQPNGAVRGVRGVYVADASLFPSASGVNPMLSVQALSYYLAKNE